MKAKQRFLDGMRGLALRVPGRITGAVLLAAAGFMAVAGTAQARMARQNPFGNVAPVTEAELAQLRGGFATGGDAIVRFGFDFSGSVNDQSFSFPTLTLAVYSSGAAQLFDLNGNPLNGTGITNLVSNTGAGLDVSTLKPIIGTGFTGVFNLIQNSVDLARIQTVNTVTIDLLNNTLNLGMVSLQQANLSDALSLPTIAGLR